MSRTRLTSPAAVEQMAAANHVEPTRRSTVTSVERTRSARRWRSVGDMRKTLATIVLSLGLVFAAVPAYAVEGDDVDGACPIATGYWHDEFKAAAAQVAQLQETVAVQQEKLVRKQARIERQAKIIKRLRAKLAQG